MGWRQQRAREVVATAPATAWERIRCGAGSNGPRRYDWLRSPSNQPYDGQGPRWLVARRGLTHPDDPRAVAYFLVVAPAAPRLATLAPVIGERGGSACACEVSKGAVGRDQYAVRSWPGWYRHRTLARWAHAVLAITRASTRVPLPRAPPADAGNRGGHDRAV